MASAIEEKISVRTNAPSRPLPLNSHRSPIKTERLILRPFVQDDLLGLHALRRQPDVMRNTAIGRIDHDLAETQDRLNHFLPPNDASTYNFAICLATSGELIGVGGMYKVSFELGWPEVGYMFKKEHWGQGYATEFLKAFVEAWWQLPRIEACCDVDSLSLPGAIDEKVPELLTAMVESHNAASTRVLKKVGFRKFKEWTEPDCRAGFESQPVELIGFVLSAE